MPYVLHTMSKQPLAAGSLNPLANGFLPRRRNFRGSPTPLFCASAIDRPASPHHDILPQSGSSLRRTAVASCPTYSQHGSARPLKPSLKSAFSSPLPNNCHPPRTKSESFATPKSVQFKDSDLESVRLYKPMGRPARLFSSATAASDTETETESDASYLGERQAPKPVVEQVEVDYIHSSSLRWVPTAESHILLESLSLPPRRDPFATPVLHGTILVRNIAYEKDVSVRFTLDGWDTVSEVRAGYDGPVGDATTGPYATHGLWDRFRFTVSLPTGAHNRTMLLAARYAVTGTGEWWDNNGGENYTVAFRSARPKSTGIVLPLPKTRRGISPQRRSGAPLQAVTDQAMGVFIATSSSGTGRTPLRGSRAWSRR